MTNPTLEATAIDTMALKLRIIAIMAAILFSDQLSKAAALEYLSDGPVAVMPFFNLVLVWNRGVSFGMLSNTHDTGPYVLVALSMLVIAVLTYWMRRVTHKPLYIALACIIAGALGNVIDRLRHGAVVDFLDFHAFGWHYPAFNIADCAIVLGVAFIMFDSIFLEPKRLKTNNKTEQNDA